MNSLDEAFLEEASNNDKSRRIGRLKSRKFSRRDDYFEFSVSIVQPLYERLLYRCLHEYLKRSSLANMATTYD